MFLQLSFILLYNTSQRSDQVNCNLYSNVLLYSSCPTQNTITHETTVPGIRLESLDPFQLDQAKNPSSKLENLLMNCCLKVAQGCQLPNPEYLQSCSSDCNSNWIQLWLEIYSSKSSLRTCFHRTLSEKTNARRPYIRMKSKEK